MEWWSPASPIGRRVADSPDVPEHILNPTFDVLGSLVNPSR
jgi:hypothetical protein